MTTKPTTTTVTFDGVVPRRLPGRRLPTVMLPMPPQLAAVIAARQQAAKEAMAARALCIHKVSKAEVATAAAKRPPGYAEQVRAAAQLEDDTHFHIPDAAYWALRERYSPQHGRRASRGPWGPPKWAELHTRALRYAGDLDAELRWFRRFSDDLPDGVCQCRTHWHSVLHAFPPDFYSAETYFDWTVFAHDKVNERLQKPVWGRQMGRDRWTMPLSNQS